MNVAEKVRGQIREIVAEALQQARFAGVVTLERDVTAEDIDVERPKDRSHGDWATNAAMVLAREASMAPRAIAEAVLRARQLLRHPDGAGRGGRPGLHQLFPERRVVRAGAAGRAGRRRRLRAHRCGRRPAGSGGVRQRQPDRAAERGQRPPRYGGRRAVQRLGGRGLRVDREYYVNDAGNQMRMLGAAMDVRIRQLEGEDAQLPEGAYLGEYIDPRGARRFSNSTARPAGPTGGRRGSR